MAPGERIGRSPQRDLRVPSYAWKSVCGVLGATLLTVVLGVGFFAYGGVFALLSDAAALLLAAFLAPPSGRCIS